MATIREALLSIQVLGLMILASGLLGRSLVLRRDITVREARTVRLLDLYAWFGAAITGAAQAGITIPETTSFEALGRLGRLEAIEATLFLALVALQIYPLRVFRNWHRYIVRDQIPWYTDRQHDAVTWIGRLQILLTMSLPVLPPLVHHLR